MIIREAATGKGRRVVTFTVSGLEYQATVVEQSDGSRKVVELHRVLYGHYTSIAASNPRFARVTRALWELLRGPLFPQAPGGAK